MNGRGKGSTKHGKHHPSRDFRRRWWSRFKKLIAKIRNRQSEEYGKMHT